LALLIWEPVAVAMLFLGCAAYASHLLPGYRGRQMAALVLALFYESPALAVAKWSGHASLLRWGLVQAGDDANNALSLWGLDHTAIAVGLMPVFLIAIERVLSAHGDRDRRRGWVALASFAGLLVSWLHPWQGATLLIIVGGLWALRAPRRRYRRLALPVGATLAPLIYGVVLARTDPAWQAFQATTVTTAIALILAGTLPAAIYSVQASGDYRADPTALSPQLLTVSPDEHAALTYLADIRRPGGVLAPWMLSMAVPEFTGRPVFAGHSQWQPAGNGPLTNRFFSAALQDPTGAVRRAILAHSHAKFLLVGCDAPASLGRAIAPVTTRAAHFGCVVVYTVQAH
jgi:hypothetical protein